MNPEYKLEIEREDKELLVLDGLGLVRAFLARDRSARAGGYNEQAGCGNPEAITLDDVELVNSTMRARASHAAWVPVIDADQGWLARIPGDLDLIEADDDAWAAANGTDLVDEAIGRCIVPYIGLPKATKVLHLKRPRAFPVLDRFVVEMMGLAMPEQLDGHRALGLRLTRALRREGHRNIEALRRIQEATATDDVRLSLVRVLDIALWFGHPAASVGNSRRRITIEPRP